MKTIARIPLTELHTTPTLVKDFIQGKLPQFQENLFSIDTITRKVKEKKHFFSTQKRERIVQAFHRQMQKLPLTSQQKENLKKLCNEDTFTITTGHQLNLLSGPAFFIYKILQTIKTAAFLNEKIPHQYFIPVFWMATEDHDWEEIQSFKTSKNTYSIQAKEGTAVGRIVPENIDFIHELEKELKDEPLGKEIIALAKKAYISGRNLAESTQMLVQELFSSYGLLILNGDDAELKCSMRTIFRKEIEENTLYKTTKEQREYIEQHYGKVQVNPREINLFYLKEKRERILFRDGKYSTADGALSFTKEEMFQELQDSPERFSPNAVLRPAYQESILPNIAYIGGNAEIAYWLELKDYFNVIHLPFPILIPRHSMLWLNKKVIKKIEKNGFSYAAIFLPLERFIQGQISINENLSQILETEEKTLALAFDQIEKNAGATDITFAHLVKAEKQRLTKSFQRMKKRLWRAEKKKNTEKIERLTTLYAQVHPHHNWQERQWNFSVFYAEEGKNWLEKCYEALDPAEKPTLWIAEI